MGDLTAAARLDEALAELEAALDALPPEAGADAAVSAVAGPVRNLSAAAKALLRSDSEGA